jgi:hypothetical protein
MNVLHMIMRDAKAKNRKAAVSACGVSHVLRYNWNARSRVGSA